ncbi:TPA: hypothetical protein ACVGN5_006094 [Pseudomonas aeruginosa]
MSKLNTLTFFSNSTCYLSHIVRLVLAEKAIDARTLDVAVPANARLMAQFGSTMQAPALAERDLALHEVDMVVEYLEERYPHPALLPSTTVARAHTWPFKDVGVSDVAWELQPAAMVRVAITASRRIKGASLCQDLASPVMCPRYRSV